MADVSFTPTFKHTPWINNQDRVDATGFNARFGALQFDLRELADTVGEINDALRALGQEPPKVPHSLTLPPALAATSNGPAWAQDSAGFATRTGQATVAVGIMPVTLPDAATITFFRAIGQNSGVGVLVITLARASIIAAPAPATRIARVNGDANPFDNSAAADAALATVDTSVFRYFIVARIDGAAAADAVSLSGFQITYSAP
jgi:hypothetical protein